MWGNQYAYGCNDSYGTIYSPVKNHTNTWKTGNNCWLHHNEILYVFWPDSNLHLEIQFKKHSSGRKRNIFKLVKLKRIELCIIHIRMSLTQSIRHLQVKESSLFQIKGYFISLLHSFIFYIQCKIFFTAYFKGS